MHSLSAARVSLLRTPGQHYEATDAAIDSVVSAKANMKKSARRHSRWQVIFQQPNHCHNRPVVTQASRPITDLHHDNH